MKLPLLSLMIWLPLFGAWLQWGPFWPFRKRVFHPLVGVGFGVLSSVIGFFLFFSLVRENAFGLRLEENRVWISIFSIYYHLSVNGWNVLFIALVSFLFPVVSFFSWNQGSHPRFQIALLLVLQTCFLGMLCAQDLILVFLFFSLSFFPFYFFLTFSSEGKKDFQKDKIALWYFFTQMISNVFFLLGIIFLYHATDIKSFSILDLAKETSFLKGSANTLLLMSFVFFTISTLLKIPFWPFQNKWTTFVKRFHPLVNVFFIGVQIPVLFFLWSRLSFLLFRSFFEAYAFEWTCFAFTMVFVHLLLAFVQKNLQVFFALVFLALTALGVVAFSAFSLSSFLGAYLLFFQAGMVSLGYFLMLDRVLFFKFLEKDTELTLEVFSKSRLFKRSFLFLIIFVLVWFCFLGFPVLSGFPAYAFILTGVMHQWKWASVIIAAALLLLAAACVGVFQESVFSAKGEFSDEIEVPFKEKIFFSGWILFLMGMGLFPHFFIEPIRRVLSEFF